MCRSSWSTSSNFSAKSVAAWNRQKLLKNPPFKFQDRSRSSLLVPLKSLLAVLVANSSKSVSVHNRFHVKVVDSSRNRAFLKGTHNTQVWRLHTEPIRSRAPCGGVNHIDSACRVFRSIFIHGVSQKTRFCFFLIIHSNDDQFTQNFYHL